MDLTGLSAVTTPEALSAWIAANLLSPVRPQVSGPDMGAIIAKAADVLKPALKTHPIPFTSGGANPLLITTWAADYFPTYGNGRFEFEFKDTDGNLQQQPISVKRIINRSGTPYQSGISIDTTGFPDGQLIIYYSSQPIF